MKKTKVFLFASFLADIILNIKQEKQQTEIHICPICKTEYIWTINTYGDICPNITKHNENFR